MISVFFSYSHTDESLRDELEVHLAALKRQGVIDTWHDRRIGAGEEFAQTISEHLEQADIILLLVSPYFIASEYCYNVEMKRAMERHERDEARVIPVILHPCDWHDTPFGHLLAVPKDGRPVSKHPNQHDAFLEITQAIKKVARDLRPTVGMASGSPFQTTRAPVRQDIRSSNLRVKKHYTDRDRDQFLTEAFEYMANFFDGSLRELEERYAQIETDFRRIDANSFTAIIYSSGKAASQCSIWLETGGALSGRGIFYSMGDAGTRSGYNEAITVADDGHTLYLSATGMFIRTGMQGQKMTMEGGAEYYWSRLIEPLQR